MDVNVEVGPSSSSKRAATVRALTGMMQITQDPETSQVLQAMAMMNMEGEGIGDVRDYFRKRLVKMGVVKPTDEEAQEMTVELQGQPQDPNAVFLQAAAEEAQAKAAKARADVLNTVAQAELNQAKTVETLAKVGGEAAGEAVATATSPAPAAVPVVDEYEAAKKELKLQTAQIEAAMRLIELQKAVQERDERSEKPDNSQESEDDDRLRAEMESLRQMVEALVTKMSEQQSAPQPQPIIVNTAGGSKRIQITKTASGFSGEVVTED
jgi:hypothetical protein